MQGDRIEEALRLAPVYLWQEPIEVDSVLDLRCPEEPGENDLGARVTRLDSTVEHPKQADVLLGARLAEPEAGGVDLVPELPVDHRQLGSGRVFGPIGAVGPITGSRGLDEGPEVVQVVLRRWMVRPVGGPGGRAVNGRQHPDPLFGGRTDDRVVVAPVIGRAGRGLDGAPDEVDPQGPDLAGAHPGDLRGVRVVRGDHTVEGARRGRLRGPGGHQADQQSRRNDEKTSHGVAPTPACRRRRRSLRRGSDGRWAWRPWDARRPTILRP